MATQYFRCIVIYTFAVGSICAGIIAYDERNNNNYNDNHNNNNNINNSVYEVEEKSLPSSTWLQSAQDMITSPAGHVAVQVAKELLNRSAGNSQVLSLNLTNLLIIVLLKILIFAAGMLGAGHWSGYGYGYAARTGARSDDAGMKLGFGDGEDYLITGFLAAQGAGLDDCLYAAACATPQMAYEYAKAARALLEGLEKYEGNALSNPRYNDLIVLVERAAYDGYRGLPCNTTVACDSLL